MGLNSKLSFECPISFEGSAFLKYPELRSAVLTSMKNPHHEISLDLEKLAEEEPSSITSKVRFVFESFLHTLKLYLSSTYKQTFITVTDKVKRVVRKSLMEYHKKTAREKFLKVRALRKWKALVHGRQEMSTLEKQIDACGKALLLLKPQIEILQASRLVKEKLENDAKLAQEAIEVSNLELMKLNESPLRLFITERNEKTVAENKKLTDLNLHLRAIQEQLPSIQSAYLQDLPKLKEKLAREKNLKLELDDLQAKLADLQSKFGKRQQTYAFVNEPKKASTTPKQMMLDQIELLINKEMATLWSAFFGRFDSGTISSWHCTQERKFKITLSSPMKLWVPKQADTDPHGGSILILGSEGTVEGLLDPKSKTIIFEKGFNIFCKKIVHMNVHARQFIFNDSNDVILEAGKLGQYQRRSKSLKEYLTAWGELGEVVRGDHAAFLSSKS